MCEREKLEGEKRRKEGERLRREEKTEPTQATSPLLFLIACFLLLLLHHLCYLCRYHAYNKHSSADDVTMTGEGGERRRSPNVRRKNTSLLFLVVLIFAQSCILSIGAEARCFPHRTQFLEFSHLPVASSSQEFGGAPLEGDMENFLEGEKRRTPTGPNPLHNK